MPLGNTQSNYGALTKTLHWLTALLILTALPLGFLAHQAPLATGDEIAHKAWLFSLHKTVGISAFLVAALRILWAVSQIRPGLLNSENRIEAFAAHTIHWLLYGSMLLVPLTGWVHHASTVGFAPILWPFGQSLPFVAKSESLASLTSSLHFIFMLVLGFSILAHVGGALKHLVIDRDQTLQRMMPGHNSAPDPAPETSSRTPRIAAFVIWILALGIGAGAGLFSQSEQDKDAVVLAKVSSDWQVTEGSLTISVHQFGSDVEGRFADWTAAIRFNEAATDGTHGDVEVQIALGSLTLGSVSEQALGADFLDASRFPTATYTADILPAEGSFIAKGTLALKGASVPIDLAFSLSIADDVATMSGETTLDRRDFAIGASMPDESSLSFPVIVRVALTATRGS